jgi:hypothetical protein
MHMNKRIGRLKQWAGERMGGEVKTCQSDDFKAMETEMGVRHEGKPTLFWRNKILYSCALV